MVQEKPVMTTSTHFWVHSETNSYFCELVYSSTRILIRLPVLQPRQESSDFCHSMRDDLSEILQKSERSFLLFLQGQRQSNVALTKHCTVYKTTVALSSRSPLCDEPKRIVVWHWAVWEHNKIPVLNLRPAAQLSCVRLLCTQRGFTPTKDKHFI